MSVRNVIVVGGGIAGLVAARVLSDHCERVTILEKDPRAGSTDPRPGAPQGAHLHVLVQRGQEILEALFPEAMKVLEQCPSLDWAADTKWETSGGAFPQYCSEVRTRSFSRPLLEGTLYSLLLKRRNVSFRVAQVEKLTRQGSRTIQVECLDHTKHVADLLVLAGGQNFPVQKLLPSIPVDEQVRSFPILITYRSALFATSDLHWDGFKQYYYQFSPPGDPLGGVVCPIEGGRSVATIIEYGSAQSPKVGISGFMALAKRVPGGKFAKILGESAPLTPISAFHKASMYQRLPHRISGFPENVLLMGDGFCSLNPVFGQGMTAALEQALLLQRILKDGNISSREFHRLSASRMRLPFHLSKVGSSTADGIAERYLRNFLSRSRASVWVHRRFLRVLHMKASYGALFDPISLGRSILT